MLKKNFWMSRRRCRSFDFLTKNQSKRCNSIEHTGGSFVVLAFYGPPFFCAHKSSWSSELKYANQASYFERSKWSWKSGRQKSKSTMNNEDGLNSKLIEWIRWSVNELQTVVGEVLVNHKLWRHSILKLFVESSPNDQRNFCLSVAVWNRKKSLSHQIPSSRRIWIDTNRFCDRVANSDQKSVKEAAVFCG